MTDLLPMRAGLPAPEPPSPPAPHPPITPENPEGVPPSAFVIRACTASHQL